jgi:hypothetical protein
MNRADDKAQALFDNCFKILNGPDAPALTIQELDKELILYISNPQGSNNFNELYSELDATIPQVDTAGNPLNPELRKYRFQGYQIYQVKDATVGPDQLRNESMAQLVAQVDVKDTVGQIINWIQGPGHEPGRAAGNGERRGHGHRAFLPCGKGPLQHQPTPR